MPKMRTMTVLSYGILEPRHLFEKLKREAVRLTDTPHPDDVFNFIVTAAVLAEWIQQHYEMESLPESFSSPTKQRKEWSIPDLWVARINDLSCFPNPGNGLKRHIANSLTICADTANASKHYHWRDNGRINAIGESPPINDFYSYFFTSLVPDLYFTINGENYGLQQIKGILVQFFEAALDYLESPLLE